MVDRKTIAYYPGYRVQNRIIDNIDIADMQLAKINSYLRIAKEENMRYEIMKFFNAVNLIYCSLIDKVKNITEKKQKQIRTKT